MPKFKSDVWAGYECTYALNEIGERLDMLAATGHDRMVRSDYRLAADIGIKTVREGLAWNQIDRGQGEYDFSRFEPLMRVAREEGMEQIWDLNHFDFPSYLDPFTDAFGRAFAEYAKRAVTLIRRYRTGTIYIVPINEISFFAWIGADQGVWAPYGRGPGVGERFKIQLVKASIAAMDAMWAVDGDVRFIQTDPVMRRLVFDPADHKAIAHAQAFNHTVRFEAWDMLSGRTFPELGGDSKYLDIIGMNYYVHNQERVRTGKDGKLVFQALPWHSRYRISLAEIAGEIFARYGRPLIISETGSFGEMRDRWWRRTLAQINAGREGGLPIHAVCAYPVLDRPATVNYLERYSGMWDFPADGTLRRQPHAPSITRISRYILRQEARVTWESAGERLSL